MRLSRDISRWNKLTARQKMHWLKAAALLLLVGISLKLLPFSTFRKWYLKLIESFPLKPVPDTEIPDITWSVESAARILPMKLLCLPQALVVRYLLSGSEGVKMHIGVNKDPVTGFQFHAWIEKQGKTIIGDLPAYYQPLWVWD